MEALLRGGLQLCAKWRRCSEVAAPRGGAAQRLVAALRHVEALLRGGRGRVFGAGRVAALVPSKSVRGVPPGQRRWGSLLRFERRAEGVDGRAQGYEN